MRDFLCIGHRGACGYEPENTLDSFEKAIALGCPWIELDVYAIENELLVIHDSSLERTTNGQGKVMDASVDYLRSLDAGNGQQIPTLLEVVQQVDRRCGINIELKGPDTAIPASDFLNTLCQTKADQDQFIISSFNHKELAKTDNRYRRGALFARDADYIKLSKKLDAYSINLSRQLISRSIVEQAHRHNLKIFVYTVNEPEDIRQMIEMHVDGIFSNFPDRALIELASYS